MKAAKSWRRKGTSGRPDRFGAPQQQPGRQTGHDQQHHGNKANSRLVAAKRLYRTLQFLYGRFLKLTSADVVSDSQPVHI